MKNKFNGYKEYISSLLISFLIALLISIAVFTAIYLYGEKIINEYVSSDSYIYNTQAAYITDFQKYVSKVKPHRSIVDEAVVSDASALS